MTAASAATIVICLAATAGVLARPWRLSEAAWPCLGAALLVAFGLLPLRLAGLAVAKGADVYLFLSGMMLLSNLLCMGFLTVAAWYGFRLVHTTWRGTTIGTLKRSGA